jgi:hypothetical protein
MLESVTESFDRAAFATTYADELAAESEVAEMLAQLDARATELGDGFQTDPLCQKQTAFLQHRAKEWDIRRGHESWKEANPEKYAEWQAANEAIRSAE